MPCNSDYMESSDHEKAATAILQLLDELDGKPLDHEKFGDGYDKRVYNKSPNLDALTKKLCSRLQKEDVSAYSLEMQMWWRNHQIADAKRKLVDEQKSAEKKSIKKALRKLTPEEQKILGINKS